MSESLKHFYFCIKDTHGIHPLLTLGMCLPDSCKAEDVDGILKLGKEFSIVIPFVLYIEEIPLELK